MKAYRASSFCLPLRIELAPFVYPLEIELVPYPLNIELDREIDTCMHRDTEVQIDTCMHIDGEGYIQRLIDIHMRGSAPTSHAPMYLSS